MRSWRKREATIKSGLSRRDVFKAGLGLQPDMGHSTQSRAQIVIGRFFAPGINHATRGNAQHHGAVGGALKQGDHPQRRGAGLGPLPARKT